MLNPGYLHMVFVVFACVLTNNPIQKYHGYLCPKRNFTVDSLYAEAIEAMKFRIALSVSSAELIFILGDIKSEARL
jgi:hypothetical protein